MKITDTYKAAYFMTQGAKIVDVEIRKTPSKKKLFNNTWIIELEDVSEKSLDTWNKGTAMVYVNDFRRERLRIKKYVKNSNSRQQ